MPGARSGIPRNKEEREKTLHGRSSVCGKDGSKGLQTIRGLVQLLRPVGQERIIKTGLYLAWSHGLTACFGRDLGLQLKLKSM